MLKSNWLRYVAIGGCLIGSLLFFAFDSSAQTAEKPPNGPPSSAAETTQNQYKESQNPEGFIQRTRRAIDPTRAPIPCENCDTSTREWPQDYKESEDLRAQIAMADYAFGILLLTIGQTVFGVLGLVLIGFTLKYTRDTAKAGIDAAKASLISAKAAEKQGAESEKIFELSEKQFLLSGRQTDLAEKQHALERLQFVAANRPKLLVSVWRVDSHTSGPVKVIMKVANIGVTPLKKLEVHCCIIQKSYIPTDVPLVLVDPDKSDLKSGEIARIRYTSEIMEPTSLTEEIFCIGTTAYTDEIGTIRYGAFCRQYDRTTERFITVNDPDYEYQY